MFLIFYYSTSLHLGWKFICVLNILCKFLHTNRVSLQLDESTLPGNEALLLGSIYQRWKYVPRTAFCYIFRDWYQRRIDFLGRGTLFYWQSYSMEEHCFCCDWWCTVYDWSSSWFYSSLNAKTAWYTGYSLRDSQAAFSSKKA